MNQFWNVYFWASISIVLLLTACGNKVIKTAAAVPLPQKQLVVEGLNHPWSMAFLSEGEALITEKDGDLLRVNLNSGAKTPVEGFPDDLVDSIRQKDARDNSGMFEVLLHPDFEKEKWIYLSYAAKNQYGTTTKIIRANLEGDSLKNVQTLFEASPYTSDLFHYGGGMTFGADGKLYFTIGERLYNEREEPALPIAQDLRDKRGKIYRLNPDGTVPPDNPDFGDEAIPGIFAIGIRAAQGITLNTITGEIWFSEHGSTQGDELNLLKAGANYGWPIKTTGAYRNADYKAPVMADQVFTDPVYYWQQTIAPTGLIFYKGVEFPFWKGDVLLCGLSRGSFWRLKMKNNQIVSVEELFINERVRLRKVVESPEGKLYLLTDEPNGKLLRIK